VEIRFSESVALRHRSELSAGPDTPAWVSQDRSTVGDLATAKMIGDFRQEAGAASAAATEAYQAKR